VDWENPGFKEKKEKDVGMPDYILKEFAKNEPALANFTGLAQTYKLQYILWITNAKRNETKVKRVKESIGLLKENRKLGLK